MLLIMVGSKDFMAAQVLLLRARQGLPRGHHALRHRHIRFADGTIDFAGPRGGFEAVRKQITLY